jgi:hypothetical protein
MLVVYYSTCQYEGIHTLIKDFIENYEYIYIENWKTIGNKKDLPIETLNKADIFIYQYIDKIHGKYTTDLTIQDNILSLLNKNCIIYGIPYIRNDGYWSIIPFTHCYNGCTGGQSEILEYKQNGHSIDNILKMYNENLLNFNQLNRFNNSLKHMEENEKNMHNNLTFTYYKQYNIYLSDFIKTNYKFHDLFVTHLHPSSYIYYYIANELLYNYKLIKPYIDIFKKSKIFKGMAGDESENELFKHSKYSLLELSLSFENILIDDQQCKNEIIKIYNKGYIDYPNK